MMMMAFSFMDMKTSLQKILSGSTGSILAWLAVIMVAALHCITLSFSLKMYFLLEKSTKNFELNQKSFMERKDKSVKHFLFF